MRLICWNVNSIKVRLPRLLGVLTRHRPDVVCLQETKCLEENFPAAELAAAGYRSACVGQKSYNGVAILAREPLQDVLLGFADVQFDMQARLMSATVAGVRFICAYVPNGSAVGTPAYAYKLQWLARLRAYLQATHTPQEPLVLCGDLNMVQRACDVAQPDVWAHSVLFHPQMRAALAELQAWGLVDVFAQAHPQGGLYSWWDYRRLGFAKNHGLRIDHILATAPLAKSFGALSIDREERKGVQPSDHAPVVADFDASAISS